MKDMKIIEEKVNALTSEQKDKIIKVNRIGIALILLTMLLVFISMFLITAAFLENPKAYEHLDRFVIMIVSSAVGGIVLFFAEYFIIKKIVPYYDDKVCRYIKKDRKKNK